MHGKIIDVRDLTIVFKGESESVTAVDHISFAIGRGKILGMVGESGSGKSVTALAIMGLLPKHEARITSGSIMFSGLETEDSSDLCSLEENEMRKIRGNRISMIFQEPMTSLNPVMRCGKQVAEVLLVHKKLASREAKARVLGLFREVMLPEPERIFRAYPHELSGGQKQRVMIAMAMACEPDLLIADEPTTALDVTVQKTILAIIKNLQRKHLTSVLFITHDLAVVAEIADDVVVMNKGAIVEQGSTEDVFHHPVHYYTKGLLACRPSLGVRLEKLPTVSDYIEDNSFRLTGQSTNDVNLITRGERLASMYGKPPVLSLHHVKTYFTGESGLFGKSSSIIKAVDDISFDVFPGETIGLVGESGCGKTTLGRTLLRLVDSSGGDIIYKGAEISKKTRDMKSFRKQFQIIFQDPYSSLNPRLMIGSAIMEPMKVHGIGRSNHERKLKTLEILNKVGLEASHFNRYPHEFSGGQRQRVCIARALAVEPEFIVCDESVSALDVSVQAQVLNLLNDLKREFGFTYIFISHDLSVVKFMSDRIFVMKDGRIIESDEADELYRNPKTEYTRNLLDAIPKGK